MDWRRLAETILDLNRAQAGCVFALDFPDVVIILISTGQPRLTFPMLGNSRTAGHVLQVFCILRLPDHVALGLFAGGSLDRYTDRSC